MKLHRRSSVPVVLSLVALLVGCGPRVPIDPMPDPQPLPLGPGVLAAPEVRKMEDVDVGLRIDPRSAIALQFVLEYDPDALLLVGVNASPATKRASKELTARPAGPGRARVVVFGFNLETLPDGTLGQVRFRGVSDVKRTEVRAVQVLVSDAAGEELPTAVPDGRIQVGGR